MWMLLKSCSLYLLPILLAQSIVADCKAIVQVFKEAETSTATGKLEAADALARIGFRQPESFIAYDHPPFVFMEALHLDLKIQG